MTHPTEKVVLATSNFMMSSLIFVAKQEGIFAREGLDVDIVIMPTGKDALSLSLAGHADVAALASPPLTQAILEGNHPHIIATIAKSERAFVILANSARGIRQASDLRGKRVAIKPGTSFEYFLDSTLIDVGIPPSEVTKVNIAPAEALSAMKNGVVDAAVQTAPFNRQEIQSLKIPTVVISSPVYTVHWNIVISDSLMTSRPTVVKKLLRTLLDAEVFTRQHPARAMSDAAQWMRMPQEDLAPHWESYVFRVQLPQSLIVGMEDEMRWTQASPTSKPQSIAAPNFLDYLDIAPLRELKPEAIRITR